MTQKTTKRLVLDLEDVAALLVGRTLSGRYVLESVLGQGGMGTVYGARHQVIGRRYAVKVLRREIASDHDTVLRFIQEAKIAGSLAHPNVVEVIDFGEVPSDAQTAFAAPFMVMPLLEGRTMAEILQREGPMEGARAGRLFAQAAEGLAAAHEKGVVHRDLKPDNLFVVREGSKETVKVLDFGVAKLIKAPKLTKHGTVFGTPYYMSPEQAGGREVDPRTDQYALGVVMYEVLSGRVPFDDDTPMGVMTKHLFATPEPLEAVVRDHQRLGRMGPIVMRCLEKRRENRFADMTELAEALRTAAGEARASMPSTPDRAPTTSRGTVRLADAAPRRVAPTEVELASSGAAPSTSIGGQATPRSGPSGAMLAALGVGALLLGAGAFVGYRALVPRADAPQAAAGADTAPREPPASDLQPSAAPADPREARSGDAPSSPAPASSADRAVPPSVLSSATASAALAQPNGPRAVPARTGAATATVAPAAAPTAKTKIDPNVW